MSTVYIHTNEKGRVTVTYPAPEALESMTHEEIMAKDCPDHAAMIDNDLLPNDDMDFFDAWTLVNGAVIVDLEAAKEITKNRLRFERGPLLTAQDVAFQRALETGADTTAIVAEKQRLRNLPTLADTCTTLDELRALKAK
jgi:hypothetical protein